MSGRGSEGFKGVMKSIGKLRLLIGLSFVAVLVLAPAMGALADTSHLDVVAQTPYEGPEIDEVEPPGWLAPFEPLARLPLWGQAAVLSAGVAGMFFVVPMVFRWVWRLGPDDKDSDLDEDAGDEL
jgi:hypothetical protein